jgi:uncharacterized protein YciI
LAKFALLITYGDKAKRDETRPRHREYLTSLYERGKLAFSGPFADDDGALIMYECADDAEAHELLAADPYSQVEGLLADSQIREWRQILPPS